MHLVVTGAAAAAITDVDEAISVVGQQYSRADVLVVGRPGEKQRSVGVTRAAMGSSSPPSAWLPPTLSVSTQSLTASQ